MNLKEIREMISLMNEHGLVELELEREGTKIKLRKSSSGEIEVMHAPSAAVKPAAAPAAAPSPAATAPAESKNGIEITSPMVGTFYRAPSPDAPPFVEVGQTVEVGQVVCIIEAMKLMNEIKSEVRGKIIEAPVENAEPIEFGQTLFTVEPI